MFKRDKYKLGDASRIYIWHTPISNWLLLQILKITSLWFWNYFSIRSFSEIIISNLLWFEISAFYTLILPYLSSSVEVLTLCFRDTNGSHPLRTVCNTCTRSISQFAFVPILLFPPVTMEKVDSPAITGEFHLSSGSHLFCPSAGLTEWVTHFFSWIFNLFLPMATCYQYSQCSLNPVSSSSYSPFPISKELSTFFPPPPPPTHSLSTPIWLLSQPLHWLVPANDIRIVKLIGHFEVCLTWSIFTLLLSPWITGFPPPPYLTVPSPFFWEGILFCLNFIY